MNLVAAFELVPAFLIGWLVWVLAGRHEPTALLVCGALLLLGDLTLRVRARAAHGAPASWLWARTAGGVVFVFPVWALGVVQLGVGAARVLGLAA